MSLRPLRSALESWRPAPSLPSAPLAAIAASWATIVGADVAAHCAPVEANGDVLVIATRSSAWSQQLGFLSVTILERVHSVGATQITRLRFRSGRLRSTRASNSRLPPLERSRAARPVGAAPPPAADAWDALERVRRRINRLQHARPSRCAACGAGLPAHVSAGMCAPCAGGASAARFVAMQRALYAMPWLDYAGMRGQMPGLEPAEYDRVRRHLLARWRRALEWARRNGRLSPGGFERQIAGSYVILKSRLAPDSVTPAVVANLLGADLAELLWGCAPVSSK